MKTALKESPAYWTSVSILSVSHRPSKNARTAEHVVIVTQSTVVGNKKAASHITANSALTNS